MDTKAATREYRLAQWAQIISAKAQSGQTVNEFCTAAGISRNAYFYWQKKHREAATHELVSARTEKSLVTTPSGWAVCTETKPTATNELTIEIGKCKITADASTDSELLEKVCRILTALC